MGVVYRAYDTELERVVAIKVLHDDLDEQFAGWLLQEARLLARLEDPHIVPIHDVGLHGARLFIVMRFVEGVPLRRFLRAQPVSRRVLLRLLDEVASGLQAVHGAGMLHRDLKPDNIMVDARGAAWIVDFGLAQLVESRREAGAAPSGTRRYMAPERLAGAPASPESDQYALCATFLEAFEGVGCPRSCRRALERGVRADPDARFQSVAALRGAIGQGLGRRRSSIAVSLGFVATTALLVFASARNPEPIALGHAAWDELMARPRVATSLERLELRSDSAAAEALSIMEEDWDRAGRERSGLRARENAARSRERQACFARLAREFDTTLHTHAEFGLPQADLAPALARLESPQQCVQPWLPRTRPQVPLDPGLARRVETLRVRASDASMLIDLDSQAAARQLASLGADIEAAGYPPLRAEFLYVQGWATVANGDFSEGVAQLEEAYFAALQTGEAGLAAWSVGAMVRGLVELGRYDEARIWARQGLADTPEDATDANTAADRVGLLIEAALVARRLNRLDEAGARLQEAETLLEHVDDPEIDANIRPGLYAEIGRYNLAVGNPGQAVAADDRVLDLLAESLGRDTQVYQAGLINLARTARRAEEFEVARSAIEELHSAPAMYLDRNSWALGQLQGGAVELAEGNDVAAWDYVQPALGLDLPPTVEVPLRMVAMELAIRLGHRDPFVEFDAGMRSANAAQGAKTRLRELMLGAASRYGYCHLGQADDCLGG